VMMRRRSFASSLGADDDASMLATVRDGVQETVAAVARGWRRGAHNDVVDPLLRVSR
jgi:hypothetical protein